MSHSVNLKPRPLRKPGLFFESRLRRIGIEKARHEHNENSLHFPRRHVAAEAAEAAAPEATEAASAAPRRLVRTPTHGC